MKHEDLLITVAEKLGMSFEATGSSALSSKPSKFSYPELRQHDIPSKLKSWVYHCCRLTQASGSEDVGQLCLHICNAADHWAGDHSICEKIDNSKQCVLKKWGREKAKYDLNGKTHIALRNWLAQNVKEHSFKYYTRTREKLLK